MKNLKSTTAKQSWWTVFKSYLEPKMLIMLALGFGSGLPFMMGFSKLSRWLNDVDIDKATIGYFYWIGLAYGLKFLWAPVVDRYRIPVLFKALGQRRSWIVMAIAGTAIGMLFISESTPAAGVAGSLTPIIIGAAILIYSGATLDIALDAWRIESGTNDEQANLAAMYQLGYRFAIMAAGYAMVSADYIGWGGAYKLTALVMIAIGVGVIFLVKEPPANKLNVQATSLSESVNAYVIEPFSSFVRRFGVWILPILVLVCIYRLSDFTMGVMVQPLYADLGFSKTTVGLVQGTFGPWPALVGAIGGGLFCLRYGLMLGLVVGAVMTIITNGAFAWLSLQTDQSVAKLGTVIIADNVASGFVVTVFIAYMSSLVDRRYAATQYALLSSGFALFCKTIAGFSGVVYKALGPFDFFLVTAAYAIPAVFVILYIWRFGPDQAKGIRAEEP